MERNIFENRLAQFWFIAVVLIIVIISLFTFLFLFLFLLLQMTSSKIVQIKITRMDEFQTL